MINKNICLNLGFKALEHFTIADNLIFDLGRNKQLSIGAVGTPNEMICLTESDPDDYKKITDVIILHNYDYDGYISEEKLKSYIEVLKSVKS